MALEKCVKRFYPKLALRILFHLRQVSPVNQFVFMEEFLIALNKSKSSISQTLSDLDEHGLISKHYEIRSNNMEPYLKVSITEEGLNLVEDILKHILNEKEKKKLDL